MNETDGTNMTSIARIIVYAMIVIVLFAYLLIPLIADSTTETVGYDGNNGDGVGITLAKSTATDEELPTSTLSFVLDGGGSMVIISGSYLQGIPVQDMVLAVADTMAVYVQNGELHSYVNGTDTVVNSMAWIINDGKINTMPYQWVYFPATNGEYASYSNGYANSFGLDAIAVGTGGGYTAISSGSEVTSTDSPVGLIAKPVHEGDGISEVGYTRTGA